MPSDLGSCNRTSGAIRLEAEKVFGHRATALGWLASQQVSALLKRIEHGMVA
jgi:hypothetical protein